MCVCVYVCVCSEKERAKGNGPSEPQYIDYIFNYIFKIKKSKVFKNKR